MWRGRGLRQGEALGLWWEDIDLPARVLRVRRALQRRRGGRLVLAAPKTARSRRTIPLPAQLVHDLRHTAASLLVAKGVPPCVVMEILGHSQIALTMNTYSHVAPEVSREAADRMTETLWQDDEDQADEPEVAELEDGE